VNRVVWLISAAVACNSAAKPDLSAVEDCAPGMSDRQCSISATSTATRQGGLKSIKRRYEDAKAPGSRVLDLMVWFSTNYDDIVAFMTKQVGAPPTHTHEVPSLARSAGTFDIWFSSDGTWVLSREDMKLDWYSLPFQPDSSDKKLETAERPAPTSAALWKALGRFLVEHPPVEQP
jgi:hypothetical protein